METRRRTTRQRTAINDLFDDETAFLTAQQVHDELRSRGESVGLATVYRNLQTMAEDGELDAVRSADGEMTYRRCSTHHHHHLMCRRCGTAVELGPDDAIEKWANAVAEKYGYTDAGHDLELFGLCARCSGSDTPPAGQPSGQ